MIFNILAFALFAATINEKLVEKFAKPLLGRLGLGDYVAYVALMSGLLLALGFGIDLITPLAVSLGFIAAPLAGQILTGLLIGAGSNFIHDIWPT